MWIENKVFKEDLEYINNVDFVDWKKLENKTVSLKVLTKYLPIYTNDLVKYYKNDTNIKILRYHKHMKNLFDSILSKK